MAAVPDHVRGVKSDVAHLTLDSRRDHKPLELVLGPGILTAPKLVRTIDGASTITIEVHDPQRRLLRNSLLAEKWHIELDGLRFRFVALAKSADTLTLTFEDSWVALLKEARGPKKALRKKMTRAEFIKHLVAEAAPNLGFYCPQLHRKQPIEHKKQAKKAKEEAKKNRGKGIGDVKHLTVKGQEPSPQQKELGSMALEIADSHNAPFVVQVALIAALIVESVMGEASDNVLEAIGAGGAEKADAATEIKNFLTGSGGYGGGGALGYHKSHPKATYYEIAQAVQRSGAGAASNGLSNYGQFGEEARAWAEEFNGGGGELGEVTVTEPYYFEVKKKESYWAAIKRLAKEVNWRAFIVDDTFYFMPEPELFRGMVRLAIDDDTPGIEEVDFEYDLMQADVEVSVSAYIAQWKPPPGSVVTLAGYGPASIGFGDAPGGHKIGLSGNAKAATGEGRGRYLVSSIEVPLIGDPAQRLGAITLRAPTKPLPEPAPEKTTTSRTGADGNAPSSLADAIAECDRIDALKYPYSSPGARGTPPPENGPYDCSGVTSRIAYVASGEPASTLASAELAQSFQAGPGEFLTIFAKGPDGPSGHAFLKIKTADGWRYFGTSSENPGGGAGWIGSAGEEPFDESYLAAFKQRHPKGL